MTVKSKIIIILISIIFILLLFIFLENFLIIKKKSKIILDSDNIITNYDIQERYEKALLKKREEKIKIVYKTKDIIKYKEIIKDDTELINRLTKDKKELRDQLEKSNNELKNINKKKNEIEIFGFGGIDTELEPDIYIGMKYNRNLYTGNKVDFYIGGGLAVKIYKNYGGAAILDLGIKF